MLYRRNEQVSVTTVDDGSFLVEPETQDIFYLDAVSGGVWKALEQPMALAELQALVAEAFPQVPRATIDGDIAALVKDMTERKLIVQAS
ncbi:MAG TPA: PqqD family protein [Reyranellaceae bacterium]|nr:PqqD family protein [Reyranellaceae bacterium]